MTRWKDHRWALRRGLHSNVHLQSSWIKYGAQAFVFESLIECVEEMLVQREQAFIDAYIQHDLPLYNLKPSADPRSSFRYRATEETKAKQRAAFKGKPTAPLTAETKSKISASLRGRTFTPEHLARIAAAKIARPHRHTAESRAKMSRAARGHKRRLGAKLSDETKRKIGNANRKAQLGKKHTDETKRKIGYVWLGRKHTDETKAKISAARRKHGAGGQLDGLNLMLPGAGVATRDLPQATRQT